MAHIIAIVIIALVARGVSYCYSDGNIFGFLGRWHDSQTIGVQYWLKPLGFCGKCSVWLYGTPALWILGLLPEPLYFPPVYWIAATGLVDLIDP